jgi:hypothetical protein
MDGDEQELERRSNAEGLMAVLRGFSVEALPVGAAHD